MKWTAGACAALLVAGCGAQEFASPEPSDSVVGASPDHLVFMGNRELQIIDRHGATPVVLASVSGSGAAEMFTPGTRPLPWGPITLAAGSSAAGVDCDGDGRLLWDPASQRWFHSALGVVMPGFVGDPSRNTGDPTAGFGLCLAVSQTADPTGGWWLALLSTRGWDQPLLAVTDDWIVLRNNGVDTVLVSKAAALGGDMTTRRVLPGLETGVPVQSLESIPFPLFVAVQYDLGVGAITPTLQVYLPDPDILAAVPFATQSVPGLIRGFATVATDPAGELLSPDGTGVETAWQRGNTVSVSGTIGVLGQANHPRTFLLTLYRGQEPVFPTTLQIAATDTIFGTCAPTAAGPLGGGDTVLCTALETSATEWPTRVLTTVRPATAPALYFYSIQGNNPSVPHGAGSGPTPVAALRGPDYLTVAPDPAKGGAWATTKWWMQGTVMEQPVWWR